GDRRIRRLGDGAESLRQFRDAVAVTHPHRVTLALAPDALEQGAVLDDLDLGAAELAVMAAFDLAAQLLRHRLLAVADAEHRNAGPVDLFGSERRVLVEDGRGPARENDALRPHREKCLFRLLERHDLGIDALLAHAPRNELGHLRAEIDDENLVVHGFGVLCGARTAGSSAARDAFSAGFPPPPAGEG